MLQPTQSGLQLTSAGLSFPVFIKALSHSAVLSNNSNIITSAISGEYTFTNISIMVIICTH